MYIYNSENTAFSKTFLVCFITLTYILQQVLQKQVFGNLLDLHTVINGDLHDGEKC